MEFSNIPPFRVTDFSKIPEAYAWLKEQPGDFTIMEYPKNFNLAEGELFQRLHGKKLANWYSTSSYYQMWPAVEDLDNPESYEILVSLGVKYLVLHRTLPFDIPNPVDELWWARAYKEPIKYDNLPGEAFLTRSFPGEDVLENRADPALYRLAAITKLTNGKNKIEVVGPRWDLTAAGKLFLVNLTEATVAVAVDNGVETQVLSLSPGKTVVKYLPGAYNLKIAFSDL